MTGEVLSFEVVGVPVPQGSKSIVRGRGKRGRPRLVEQSNLRSKTKAAGRLDAWRSAVGWSARAAWKGRPLLTGPLMLCARFYLPRPASVRRKFHTVKPDLSKLIRAVEDACTGIVWGDDAQIVGYEESGKYYADERLPGAEVDVVALEDERMRK